MSQPVTVRVRFAGEPKGNKAASVADRARFRIAILEVRIEQLAEELLRTQKELAMIVSLFTNVQPPPKEPA